MCLGVAAFVIAGWLLMVGGAARRCLDPLILPWLCNIAKRWWTSSNDSSETWCAPVRIQPTMNKLPGDWISAPGDMGKFVPGWQPQCKTVFWSCCLVAITWVHLKRWKLTSAPRLKFTCPTKPLGINSSIMMIREPCGMLKAQFSRRNTFQSDSTLLASIITGMFVTGDQYPSQMSSFTEKTNDRRARGWRRQGERYAHCDIVHVDRCDGGSSKSGQRYHWMVVQTCICLLEVIWWQQYIVMIFWSILSARLQEFLEMHSF